MKSFSLSVLAVLLSAISVYAQNTFPATGNVGVGTTSPATNLHIVGSGTNTDGDNAHLVNGGGLIIQGNTGARSATSGAQLEFAIPANTDGTNIWGQGRIITVAGTATGSNATGKMIIGTRRSFNKLGTGNQWYYGDDLVIDGAGKIGIGTATPNDMLDVNGFSIFGASVEKISVGSGSLGFNRKVATGVIYDNTRFGYQFQHTGSTTAGSDYLALQVYNPGGAGINSTSLVINGLSQVGVNTTYIPTGYQFAVNGSAIATSITVQLRSSWPDYVFKKDYTLPSLSDVKTYIDQNQHLPEMPSAQEIAKDGINLGEMNKLLLKKVEELTLYLIEKDKEVKEERDLNQKQQIALSAQTLSTQAQEEKIKQLAKQLEALAKKVATKE
jgi:hypothetical protein